MKAGGYAIVPGANLSGCDLSGCDLIGTNLSGANLDGANLDRANLSDAYLSRANLHRANLSSANLSGANLRGASLRSAKLIKTNLIGTNLCGTQGFYLLPVQDPRGYAFAHATQFTDGWRIRVGCRDFTIAEARAHWGETYEGKRWIGDMYLHAVDWLEERIKQDQNQ